MKKIKFLFSLILFLLGLNFSHAQVNAYAKVTGISGSVLTISNVNETYHTFSVGEEVIVMQMQDNVISGTGDNSSFGNLGSITSAGLYEVKQITAKTATTLTLNSVPTNTYNTGINSSVQAISFRLLGSTGYTTTANIAALDWDGNVGGVVAIRVDGTLTLNHNITADGAGFRGGVQSANEGTVDCNAVWITSTSTVSGEKGEGIFKRTDAAQRYGRAKILNGGGGGNRHNAGGGGGGNVTAGGDGGAGYLCSGTPVGGQGGISLSSQISISRIAMGGGGGGGQQNNSVGSVGADGGGIILIRATQIVASGTCTGRVISANGLSAGNDGAGGAGAGGVIIFDVTSFGVVSGCTISASANGGNGGSSVDGSTHGGGGGGGQGRIIFSGATPSNVTTSTNNGAAGCNNNSSPCTSNAGTPSGTNGSGISNSAGNSPLPVSLLYFTGIFNEESGKVELKWATASEVNNDHFTIKRSFDGKNFTALTTVRGSGTSTFVNKYTYEDAGVYEKVYYYMLSQTDFDDTNAMLKLIRVELDKEFKPEVWIYPNPVQRSEKINIDFINLPFDTYSIAIINLQGSEVHRKQVEIIKEFQSIVIETNIRMNGLYNIRISSAKGVFNRKIIIH